jgi:hypothetical protein
MGDLQLIISELGSLGGARSQTGLTGIPSKALLRAASGSLFGGGGGEVMNRSGTLSRVLAVALVMVMALPPVAFGQGQESKPSFRQEEIEQLVAPIALYPDSLIAQILMASTYPLEVVQAARWAKQNKDLKGDALAVSLEKQDWDASVKSLVNFPQVLQMMSEKLDLTQKLGDAFLAQQKEVLDAIQKLRVKAQDQGSLKTTPEQKVIVEQQVIRIESANPDVVYVPTYNPTVVYGAWPYPAYPPYSYYPPGYAYAPLLAFGAGVALGAAWGNAWGNCNWGGGDIDVNRNSNRNNKHQRPGHRECRTEGTARMGREVSA